MESLIPLIIMLIVGSLFNGKKKTPADGQEKAKPFTPKGDRQEGPVKTLKDMSRDMYKELQRELEKEVEKQHPTPRQPIQQQVKVMPESVDVSVSKRERRTEPARVNRISSKEVKQVEMKKSKSSTQHLIPKSSEDMMKGVIFSEIFGPPKSKR